MEAEQEEKRRAIINTYVTMDRKTTTTPKTVPITSDRRLIC